MVCRLAFSLEHGGHAYTHNCKEDQILETHNNASHSHNQQDINLRAAFIHVIGDLVQSVGVLIASGVIWYNENWRIADPICTLLFSVIVIVSTFFICRDILNILMEGKSDGFVFHTIIILGAPKNINIEDVYKDLHSVQGVERAHDLHVWAISPGNSALTAHVTVNPDQCQQRILVQIQEILCSKYTIHHSTIQVEKNESLHCNPVYCSKK